MTAYYNEFDPKAAAWLRQLIVNGDIAPGVVDERSIIDVQPGDLAGYTQHHFFAGIGVWSYALRNAGWSDDMPVCTASLPCQPFSAAGNQKGKEDERHLLPHFLELVKECGFNTIFGEQVESAIRHGWLDDLQTVMERENYAVGHCVLGAHSINAAHQRQRLFWVADSCGERLQGHGKPREYGNETSKGREESLRHSGAGGLDSWMAHTANNGSPSSEEQGGDEATNDQQSTRTNNTTDFKGTGSPRTIPEESIGWIWCGDNKYRPIKSGIKPLVDGLARGVVYRGGAIDANNTGLARAIRLKGYGNAINADVACEFITAYMEVR